MSKVVGINADAEGMNYYEEFSKHLVEDEKPSIYFNNLVENGEFPTKYPFEVLLKLKGVEQNPKYHPEGNVWIHTMMVIDEAAKRRSRSKDSKAFMWAALLHDVGKLTTTKLRRGRITSYNHDKAGLQIAEDFLTDMGYNKKDEFFKHVANLVRLHMQILFVVKDLEDADYNKIAKSGYIEEVAILGICDRLGRGPITQEKVDEEERNIEIFLERCNNYIEKKKKMAEKYNYTYE